MATYDSETDETFIADSDEHEDDDYFNEIYDSNENLNDDELIFSDDSDIELEENFDFDKFTINLNDDNKVFLMKIQILLKKVRTLIKTVKNSNVILSYLIEKLKENSAKLPSLVLDFFIRWNSTYIMLSVLKKYRSYVSSITNEPSNIEGLDQNKMRKLESLNFSSTEWTALAALEYVLTPFYDATLSLSGSKYETISMAHIITSCLKKFLTHELIEEEEIQQAIKTVAVSINSAHKSTEFAAFCNQFKKALLHKFNLYFDTKISDEQKNKTLVNVLI